MKFLKIFLIGIILSFLVFVGLMTLLVILLNLSPGPKGDDLGKAITFMMGILISAGISLIILIGSIYIGLKTQYDKNSSQVSTKIDARNIFNKKLLLAFLLILIIVVYKILN